MYFAMRNDGNREYKNKMYEKNAIFSCMWVVAFIEEEKKIVHYSLKWDIEWG